MARLGSYLKLRRTRVILGCFLVSSALLVAFPGIDIRVAGLFYDQGFHLADRGWTILLHESVRYFIAANLIGVTGLYAFNRLSGRTVGGINGRTALYVALVMILGAGLIVNVAFKDHFGRARPRDIVELGGTEQFTPAFVISSACDRNCSFSSGDTAGAFSSLALVLVYRRRRLVAVAGIGYGVMVSIARMAAGAHFFSDTVTSFFVMLIVADALHYFMFAPGRDSAGDSAERPQPA